jgi:hypothetical protein
MPDAPPLTSALRPLKDAQGVELTSFLATGAQAGSGFIVGLVIGGFTGFLVTPAIRSWLAHREWIEASREARLADQLLDRMEIDTSGDEGRDDVDERVGSTWRTLP